MKVDYATIQRALKSGKIVECDAPFMPSGYWRRIQAARLEGSTRGGKLLWVQEHGGMGAWYCPKVARLNNAKISPTRKAVQV